MSAIAMASDSAQSPHRYMLESTVIRGFDGLREEGHNASLIAGTFRRSLDCTAATVTADTTTRAVTVQTPTLFCDLRISRDRPAIATREALDTAPLETLEKLVTTTHCFAGFSAITDIAIGCGRGRGSNTGSDGATDSSGATDAADAGRAAIDSIGDATQPRAPVCTRFICADWQPLPRTLPNRWRVEPRWEHGGWVEWSERTDRFGQAVYSEHWRTLRGSRAGPFLGLRRRRALPRSSLSGGVGGSDGGDALFLLAGSYFIFVAARAPEDALPVVVPGVNGQPAERGSVAPLARAARLAGDRGALLKMLRMECHFGRHRNLDACDHDIAGGSAQCPEFAILGDGADDGDEVGASHARFPISLSTWQWREGGCLDDWVSRLRLHDDSGDSDVDVSSIALTTTGDDVWEVFEATGITSRTQLLNLLQTSDASAR